MSLQEAAAEEGFLSDIPLVQSGINAIEKVNQVPPLTYIQ
jgi:hypothetical protein